MWGWGGEGAIPGGGWGKFKRRRPGERFVGGLMGWVSVVVVVVCVWGQVACARVYV